MGRDPLIRHEIVTGVTDRFCRSDQSAPDGKRPGNFELDRGEGEEVSETGIRRHDYTVIRKSNNYNAIIIIVMYAIRVRVLLILCMM